MEILLHLRLRTFNYIAKKEKGHTKTINFMKSLVEVMEVIGIDKEIIVKALVSEMKDFEDAIQGIAAEMNELEFIVTRNKRDYAKSQLKILTPKEFLNTVL